MAVPLRLVGLLLLFPSLAIADNGIADQQAQTLMRSFVATQLQEARTKAEAAYVNCSDSAMKAPALTANVFDRIALTNDEKRMVLFYFSAHALRLCTEKTAQALLVAAQLARMVDLPEYSVADDPHGEMVTGFALGEYRRELGYKVRYYALPTRKRLELEAIDVLQQPFNLRESARNLGLWSGGQ
ncbi:hypothetical protein LT85_4994 [Collimonas arenae]|uniref:Uncharacterized protein n=2 Tax=Collimonas arenae TaxID=279058 RepID=A0A0A1FMH0_9BURK|nr:hypothetical protein LT85_4994 [Collimonas arenae]